MFFPNAGVVIDPVLLVLLGLIVGTLGRVLRCGRRVPDYRGDCWSLACRPSIAVGTGLTLVMGSSIINMLKHKGLGHVDFRLGLLMVCGTVPGEILAERLNVALLEGGYDRPRDQVRVRHLPGGPGLVHRLRLHQGAPPRRGGRRRGFHRRAWPGRCKRCKSRPMPSGCRGGGSRRHG